MENTHMTLVLDFKKHIRVSLQELAQALEVSTDALQTICEQHRIGMLTIDDTIYIENNFEFYNGDIKMIKFYIDHPDIENEVIENIKQNQPTTPTTVGKDLDVSREMARRVIDEITLIDVNLYEDIVGKNYFLFYNDGEFISGAEAGQEIDD